MMIEHLYRYDGYTEWALRNPTQFRIIKETPCGWWIQDPFMPYDKFYDRWVSKTAKKRFAYPTKEEAMNNYIARKRRQIQFLTNNINNAENGLRYFNAFHSSVLKGHH